MHATAQEAKEETERMLNVYADFCENILAMPVTRGRKTEKEKFNGAEATYTIECMMHDRKALQAGTSHYFGDGFAKAFDITFTDQNNQRVHPHQTSWGVSTRLIGGIIMTHGDNNGLVLPPKIAPVQIVVVPVAQHKPGVLDAAAALLDRLQAAGFRAKLDDSDNSLGWKCAQWEMKGVPLRIEIGPKDLEQNQCCMVRRDNREKAFAPLAQLEQFVQAMAALFGADDLQPFMADAYFDKLGSWQQKLRENNDTPRDRATVRQELLAHFADPFAALAENAEFRRIQTKLKAVMA